MFDNRDVLARIIYVLHVMTTAGGPIPHVRTTWEDYNGATYAPLPTAVQNPILSGTSACLACLSVLPT